MSDKQAGPSSGQMQNILSRKPSSYALPVHEAAIGAVLERKLVVAPSPCVSARAGLRRNITHENDSYNFLHFANLALLLYIKLFQDQLNPYLTGHLLNRFGEYRFDVNRQPPQIAYKLPILEL